jgi:hypothetical protein
MTLSVHFRLSEVSGVSFSASPDATGVFFKGTLSPTGATAKTRAIPRRQIESSVDFSDEYVTFSMTEDLVAVSFLEIALFLQLPGDSLPFAYQTLPVRICRPGARVRGKVKFAGCPFYREVIKARWELHIATDARRQPFHDSRIELDAILLRQFLEETHGGRVAVRDERGLPPGVAQEQVDAVEAAMMTAPLEMWNQFLDPTFLKDGLKYYRIDTADTFI